MLLLHLVPVGLSLLDDVQLPDSSLTAREALQHAATGPRQELDWGRLGPAGVPRPTAPLLSGMAAEWSSITAVTGERRYASGVHGEAYVFIATDTDPGLRAATLIAERYQRPAIRYLDEPLAAERVALEPGDVYLCRIPDLDLGTRTPTSTTWRSLGAVGRLVADTATQSPDGEWHVIVHLSGGYKAMIPYLMVLAEGVHSRLRDAGPDAQHRPTIRAVVIHELSLHREPAGLPLLIDVPVRSIPAELWKSTRKLAAATQPDSDLVDPGVADHLLGLFTEVGDSGRTRRLTSAGLITVTVL